MTVVQSFFGPPIPEECANCPQHKNSKNPFLSYGGEGRSKILIVGGWPSVTEDMNNKFYSGRSGKLFKEELFSNGYRLEKDFWYTKGVGCTSPKAPTKTIIKNCKNRIHNLILKLKPKAILMFGNVGIDSVAGDWVQAASADSLCGNKIPMHDWNCWALPLFAPEIALGSNRDQNLRLYFQRTLKEALIFCRKPPPLEPLEYIDKIDILTDPVEIIQRIEDIIDTKKITSFDFETSGLDPFIPGHRVFSMSIGTTDGKAIAFPLEYPGAYHPDDIKLVWDAVYEYLESEDCPKIAHRTEFEHKWSKVVLDADIKNLAWCTKTTQHIVDNRMGITGLKHQCFVRWGIKDYDSASAPYIKSNKNSPFNNMHKMPLHEQLLYVGIDSWMTMLLYQEEREELKSLDTQRFFNDVTNMFTEMSIEGICIDLSFYEREKVHVENDIKEIYTELYNSKEIKEYERRFGSINFTSNDDIRVLFFTHLKCQVHAKTKSGIASTDAIALEKTNHWIAKKLLKAKKLEKINNTYISQFRRLASCGKIHPSFNVYIARSLRSSSSNPNFQNIPKRDELAKWITRSGLRPSPGNRFIELDYSGAEVITSSAYNKDPNLIAYLQDKDSDMHRDGASDIWFTTHENISKMVRFFIKNCWTFPQFYGDYFGSCAKALWDHRKEILKDGRTCLEVLKSKGINTLKGFTEHCKKAEKIMWGTRFKVYDQWRKDAQIEYQKDFIVKTFFGFEFKGYMDWKQVANYPIQGTSFHLLLIVLLKMRAWLKKEKMKTKLVGQIHDSGIFDSPENEYQSVIKQFQKYTHQLREEYSWLPVDMDADAEISLKDGDFAHTFKFSWDKDIKIQEAKAMKKWTEKEDKLFNKEAA